MTASAMVEPYNMATNESSAAVLTWAVLALYTVLFLLAAAFIFRRQEAQA